MPNIGGGADIWCQLFSEPGAGSDLAGLSTARRARRRLLVGRRAEGVDLAGLLRGRGACCWRAPTRTCPSTPGSPPSRVDMTSPGVDVRPMRQMNGDSHFSEVFLDGVVIPDDQRIGEVGGGWRLAVTVLAHERAGIGAGGATRGGGGLRRSQMLDHLRAVARRHRPSRPAARRRRDGPAGDAELDRQAGPGQRPVQGRPGPEGSGGKVRTSVTTMLAANLALDLEGAGGMLAGGEWQTLFLTAPSLSIRGGTDEIQRNIVGERVLGLPSEPRQDKDVPFNQTRRS